MDMNSDQISNDEKKTSYDIIIAGGGLAGTLCAVKLAIKDAESAKDSEQENQKLKIALIEQEPNLGGRLKRPNQQRSHSYGFEYLGKDVIDYIDNLLKSDPESVHVSELIAEPLQSVGVFSSGKFNQIDFEKWFTDAGARLLGGYAAKRKWSEFDDILAADAPLNKSVGQIWKGDRKSPQGYVFDQYFRSIGVPDVWDCEPYALTEIVKEFQRGLFHCDINLVCETLLSLSAVKERVEVFTSTRIVDASLQQMEPTRPIWNVTTMTSTVTTPKLIVAQPPWAAQSWLSENDWPGALAMFTNKLRPISAVTLSINASADFCSHIPDVTLIPSENVQVLKSTTGTLCFQATIDFEHSLQAPSVVKAVKRLKRAQKKLLHGVRKIVEESSESIEATKEPTEQQDLQAELQNTNSKQERPETQVSSIDYISDHKIALLPVAWTHATTIDDRKLISTLERKGYQTDHLNFCGDTFGDSVSGEANLINSINRTCDFSSHPGPA